MLDSYNQRNSLTVSITQNETKIATYLVDATSQERHCFDWQLHSGQAVHLPAGVCVHCGHHVTQS